MDQQFLESRINALNEPMMGWFNKWDPVFMCVGRKPHPFDNEWHTICFALASILWKTQILEGKVRRTQLFRRNGKIWGILLGSWYKFLSQYFKLVSVVCLTLALYFKGNCSLVGVWCLRWFPHQEEQILAQGCTRRFHWSILIWQRCYLCGYVGIHNWRWSWG